MSNRPGVSFLTPGDCIRDCRTHPFDTDDPYVPPECPNCERTVTPCGCSCIDAYPDFAAVFLGSGLDVAFDGMVVAANNDGLSCFCANADDYTATTSAITGTYYFGFDESSLAVPNRILAAAQQTCPGDPHYWVEVYAAVPTTNLACVQSYADWGDPLGTPLLDASVFGIDPGPTALQSIDAFLIEAAGHPGLIDCEATKMAQPIAYLFRFFTTCGDLLYCPNRNPGGATGECPSCGQLCIAVNIINADSFSTACNEDGQTDCTVSFSITCPGYCACAAGTATVTFTLDGISSSQDVPITCGDPAVTVMTASPFSCDVDSGNWEVVITWICTSDDTPCSASGTANCRGVICPNTSRAAVNIAIGGGVIT